MNNIMFNNLIRVLKFYIQLFKVPQTGLLMFTAFAGYRTFAGTYKYLDIIIAGIGMLLVISGTTALNMVFDRDIDHVMERTKKRPIPTEKITPISGTIVGVIMVVLGSILNFQISFLYSIIVLMGMFFDLVIYTIWLKRRSPWSIIFGGLAGGMPILAGRALSLGSIDLIGILLALSIVLWIPTHILTLAMNHSKDYKLAGVPTFPNVFGFKSSRYFIAFSNIAASAAIITIFLLLKISLLGFHICIIASMILLILSIKTFLHPEEKTYFSLFKYASVYMTGIMLILVLQGQ